MPQVLLLQRGLRTSCFLLLNFLGFLFGFLSEVFSIPALTKVPRGVLLHHWLPRFLHGCHRPSGVVQLGFLHRCCWEDLRVYVSILDDATIGVVTAINVLLFFNTESIPGSLLLSGVFFFLFFFFSMLCVLKPPV
ncbi:hypothetical protein XENOCAPTIV_024681 [Xenoophorus captivus]|uniref:Uncharacterized protein n=1 Tax=Xenoophorus captivus TaxID=1517983 RepID=A0ABV0R1Y4_9TELE